MKRIHEVWNTKSMNMKKLLLPFLSFAFTVLFSCGSDETPAESIPKADVTMKDISGKETSLQEAFKENGLLVMFSANTCPYVIKNQERTRVISQYALANKVGVIVLNSNEGTRGDDDSFEAMQAYAKEQGYQWSYVVDQKSVLADAFGATRTPECYLFNKDQSLVYHGAIDDNPSDAGNIKRTHLKAAIDEMVAGKEIAVKTSRSVGCTIKR
jgi:glutathione peroxidase-family protein